MLPPEEIAFAAIRVAVELLEKDPPPVLRSTSFDVNRDEVMLACQEILEYYKFPSSKGAPTPGQVGNGGRRQFLKQHRHEVSAFLFLACKGGV
jgi:hypothetical protein